MPSFAAPWRPQSDVAHRTGHSVNSTTPATPASKRAKLSSVSTLHPRQSHELDASDAKKDRYQLLAMRYRLAIGSGSEAVAEEIYHLLMCRRREPGEDIFTVNVNSKHADSYQTALLADVFEVAIRSLHWDINSGNDIVENCPLSEWKGRREAFEGTSSYSVEPDYMPTFRNFLIHILLETHWPRDPNRPRSKEPLMWPLGIHVAAIVLMTRCAKAPPVSQEKAQVPSEGNKKHAYRWDNCLDTPQAYRYKRMATNPKNAFVYPPPERGYLSINSNNQFNLFAACLVIAQKMILDRHETFPTKELAKVLPITDAKWLAQLEYQTLARIDYRVWVTDEQHAEASNQLAKLAEDIHRSKWFAVQHFRYNYLLDKYSNKYKSRYSVARKPIQPNIQYLIPAIPTHLDKLEEIEPDTLCFGACHACAVCTLA